jgi:1-acyl-sn-glycerol-3-phosphate acyltransferase
MIYQLVRPVARYVLSWYYRRIELDGFENIPTEGPVILAANHPTAFIEPCILACYQQRPLWFLARGNLFKNSLANWILDRLHILPVYRIEDGGYEKLKNNFATFSACRKSLKKGRAIMILAEGRCIHEKRLRPLRKGTGRVALSALAAYPELSDIPVVPIGVNFTHPEQMRSAVMIRCGEPLSVRSFLPAYQENENKGVLEFTRALARALDPLVIQIPDITYDGLGEQLLDMDRNNHATTLKQGVGYDGQQLDRELAIAQCLPTVDPVPVTAYAQRLNAMNLRDAAVSQSWRAYLNRGGFAWLKSLLACIALLWQLPLILIAEYIGGTSSRAIEFYSPVRFAVLAVGLFVYPWFWLIGLHSWLIAYSLFAIVTAKWAWKEWEATTRWWHARMAWRQTEGERKALLELRKVANEELANCQNKQHDFKVAKSSSKSSEHE